MGRKPPLRFEGAMQAHGLAAAEQGAGAGVGAREGVRREDEVGAGAPEAKWDSRSKATATDPAYLRAVAAEGKRAEAAEVAARGRRSTGGSAANGR